MTTEVTCGDMSFVYTEIFWNSLSKIIQNQQSSVKPHLSALLCNASFRLLLPSSEVALTDGERGEVR